jgi:hypothetical protein
VLGPPSFARLKASATKSREPARTGNEVGRTAKNWGVRRVGTEAQAGLPVLLEKQRRHAGCARCVDGVHVHDARSGTACRAPTGRKLKGSGPEASGMRDKNKRAGRSDFRTPVQSIGLPKPEMPALQRRRPRQKGQELILEFPISNGSVDVHVEVQVREALVESTPAPASRGITKRWQTTALQISGGLRRLG